MRAVGTALLIAVLALGVQSSSQTPAAETDHDSAVPRVGFSFEFTAGNPSYYLISVESTGHAAYRSNDGGTPEETSGTPYEVQFVVSDPTRARIFQLAERAHHFESNFEYRKGRVANTGIKTLSFSDDKKKNQTIFNYSTNQAVQELTRIFQHISTTLEFGRQLQHLYDHQKLGLDEQLKRMGHMAEDGELEEIQAVAPVLQKIANDPSVLNIDRQHAWQLLQMASVPAR